jgi:hypothetical protein
MRMQPAETWNWLRRRGPDLTLRSRNSGVVTRVASIGELNLLPETTEDALQETFLHAYLALDSLIPLREDLNSPLG